MEQKAADILEKIIYATIATANSNAEPCNSPVYVVYDEDFNFYWASYKDSQHSRNILENPRAFVAIYDSTAPWGAGDGVFIDGEVAEVHDIEEITKACKLRKNRVPAAKHPPQEFLPDKPRSIYKLVSRKIWMNRDAKVNSYFVDKRTELNLNRVWSLLSTSKTCGGKNSGLNPPNTLK